MNILLAVDGSTSTQRLLEYLVVHDTLFGSAHRYTALYVVPPVPVAIAKQVARPALVRLCVAAAERVLEPVERFALQHGLRLQTRHVVGAAGAVIAEVAAGSAADLVVIGSHGHEHELGVPYGSTTGRVLASCRVPVLIVR